MKVIVDENVPLAEALFGSHADVVKVEGRALTKYLIDDASALICRSVTAVNADLLEGTAVEFVGSCTIGVDHLDIQFLDQKNIGWAHAPGSNAQSVVEYVSSCLSALGSLQEGLRAAVIGCGNVGSAVYRELEDLGIDVVAYDPFLQQRAGIPEEIEESTSISFVELADAMGSDVVCLHTPYTRDGRYPTYQMLGEPELAQLKANAIVISAGRGGVLNESAMLATFRQRPDIRWVLDVWENEPQIGETSLKTATIATPHVAGYSLEGKQNGSRQVYQSFCRYFDLEPVDAATDASQSVDVKGQSKSAHQLDSLAELLLSVYDPREDDARMRAQYGAASLEDLETGVWFDSLRKDYPVRRERSMHCFPSSALIKKQVDTAKKLGFKFGD